MTNTATHNSWKAMKTRCTNPNAQYYADYGGRGITICERWLHSFENFLADMGERPAGMSIERLDNEKGYEPGNCVWATATQQARNQTKTRFTEGAINEILGRLEHGESPTSVARRFGASAAQVCQIRDGRIWVGAAPAFSG